MISGVILAAGKARRMGQAKQLLPLGGKPAIWRVAANACQSLLGEIIVVTGAFAETAAAVADLPVKVTFNPLWDKGQSTSVKTGVEAVSPNAEAILFLLADQPFVDSQFINRVILAYQENKGTIIVPRHLGRRGHPVLFALDRWRAGLLGLSGDEGGRRIIQEAPETVFFLEVADDRPFLDMDTPQDYEIMQKIWMEHGG